MKGNLKKGLIVSCQAVSGDPFFGSENIVKMALSAEMGGAVGLRINSAEDIKAVKEQLKIPVIGIVKRRYENSLAYITPTIKEVMEVINAGADIVCIDGTSSLKPDGKTTKELIMDIKSKFNTSVMVDISTAEEGISAFEAGADIIATTLAGYDDYRKGKPYDPNDNFKAPDFQIIEELCAKVSVPVVAEGRYWNPEDVVEAIKLGAHSVVVGSAITRPHLITRRMTNAIDKYFSGL